MNKPVICFVRGCGGHWLGNLIWRLENNKFDLSEVDVVFDYETVTDSFELSCKFFENHRFETDDQINFSSPCWFTQYINDAVKVKYHIMDLGEKSIQEQFFTLSNSAKYILTDPLWQQIWKVRGDLEYSLLSQNPDKFITQLFAILDKFKIEYSPNKEYCLNSIDYYKSTCPDPVHHLYNFDSLLWLAWCHADVLIRKESLTESIKPDATVESIRAIIEPVSAHMLQRKIIYETTA